MEFQVSRPTVRPTHPFKTKSKNQTSKLSLKSRQKTAGSCIENRRQALPANGKYLPKIAEVHSGKDLSSSLISSDESDSDAKLLGDSIFLEGSQLPFPNAESTRLEVGLRLSRESNQGSFFSCQSQLTPPSGGSSDGEEPQGACEESIIYISDGETLPASKPKSFINLVIPESTESDSVDEKEKPGQRHTESKDEVIVLDSSSDDSSFLRKKHLVGKSVLSKLNDLSKNKQDKWRNIVIPPSDSDESDDIIGSSLHAPGLIQRRDNVNTPASHGKKSSYTPVRRVIPETSEEESVQEEEEISPRALAAEKLSETKVDFIQRWIDENDSAGSDSFTKDRESRSSPVKPPSRQASSPVKPPSRQASSPVKPSSRQASSPVKQSRQSGDGKSSSDDSFDDLIRRENKAPKKTPAKSSFIVDSSSSDDSFSNYRKVLTKDIRRDVDIDRTPFGVLTGKPKPAARRRRDLFPDSTSESDAESSCSSESDPSSEEKKRGRQPARKPRKPKKGEPIPDKRKPRLESDSWSPFKKPNDTFRPTKKSADDTPKTLKKPVDTPTLKKPVDTPRTLTKPVDSTPRALKKPVNDTPRPSKKPTDTPRTLKKPVEDLSGTPANTPKGSRHGKVEELKKPGTPYSPIRTFLTSLSGPARDPNLRNHPEASIYFKNYKSKREELARRLFKLFNREVFDSRLPDDMVLEWSGRMLSTAGTCSCKLIRKPEGSVRTARIVLSSKILDSADRLRDTLIHELCHAAVWLLNEISGGHGPFWKAWARKAEKRFPELPKITVCHAYSVETKFTYKCKDCGYSFGRHSKSINLETQRCGHCYGTFELLVNKGRNQGGSGAPATPRAPTGFALFVKENYGSVKKEHSDKKHGDIMKLLGQKFAQVKIAQ